MKKIFIILIIILTVVFISNKNKVIKVETLDNIEEQEEVHIHAGFQVYKNNTLLDFSDFKFMHIEPCSEDESHQLEDEQIEKAHLHNNIGNIVHVHKPEVMWKDLFQNINVSISPNAVAYINRELVEDFLNRPIQEYDSLVIFEGENDNEKNKLSNSVSKQQITDAEILIESCSK